ncbi:MAG: S41 family peptidase [Clostridia bacterium]|nr:S41 family peptidase [Clostridia bacterium]
MKKKIEIGTVIFIVIVAVVLACLATYMYLTSMMPSLVTKENFYDRITEVNKTIEQRYVGEADTDAAMDSLLTGYVSAIDKYSTYLSEEEYASYTSQMNGKYSGAGITVKYISATGLLKIINVKSNSPAAQADIEIGDIIFKIGDRNVEEMSYEEAINLLRAENGTVISLSLLRGEQELEKSVTIGEYVTSSVEYEMIESDVGYVAISEFDNTTFDDFKKAVESLENDGAAQFIFDVRNNTGGSLTSVVNILDFLLPEGTLVTLKDNAGKETVHSSDANSFSKKYAVLINGFTYSGGELFAAAVRDFKAGTLVGETTYGKGYAQEIIPLSRGALYLSTKMYYPPNGENYDGIGVSPDVEAKLSAQLEDRFYELDYKEDTQIIAALNALGKQVA